MFQVARKRTMLSAFFEICGLIYHGIVHDVRKAHGNALIGLFMNILQTLMLVIAFYFMYAVLGIKGSSIRGDFLLYIMSGIFLFMVHSKAMGAVIKSEGPTSSMMKHAPLNTIVAIGSSALSSLYTQILSLMVVLFLYDVIMRPVHIDQPIGAFACLLISWFSGVAVGTVFLSLKPWYPGFATIAGQLYARANMIASGKMFVANSMSAKMLALFSWNPLFHTIDQCRGFVFLNYHPHYSSFMYPIYVSLVIIVLGMMGEFFTRQNASASWNAAR